MWKGREKTKSVYANYQTKIEHNKNQQEQAKIEELEGQRDGCDLKQNKLIVPILISLRGIQQISVWICILLI